MSQGQDIVEFILRSLVNHPVDLASFTAKHFSVSRQLVNRHLKQLIDEGRIRKIGQTRGARYQLVAEVLLSTSIRLGPEMSEDVVYRQHVFPILKRLECSAQIVDRVAYCFTEMFNNAIDHSEGTTVNISVQREGKQLILVIEDDGVGIFEKIKKSFDLEDERVAILELSKGKLTTAAAKHSGEGIFFSSRVAESFVMVSHTHSFVCVEESDWLIESSDYADGTWIEMRFDLTSTRTSAEVFRRFEGKDHGFTITHVPVALAAIGEENLISRSQAKRLLARLDTFEHITLDFKGVHMIGQAFGDEIFRVFRNEHPSVVIEFVNTEPDVLRMIKRAEHARLSQT